MHMVVIFCPLSTDVRLTWVDFSNSIPCILEEETKDGKLCGLS